MIMSQFTIKFRHLHSRSHTLFSPAGHLEGKIEPKGHKGMKQIIILKKLFPVRLTGGSHAGEGNVYAYNPALKKEGAVCDDYWDINAVSCSLLYHIAIVSVT